MTDSRLRYKTLIDFSRILALFENQSAEELSVAGISKSLRMLPSKVSRMLATLENEGFFSKNTISGKYRIGARYLQAGLLYVHNHPLRRIILPHMEQISNEVKTLSSWAIFENNRVFIVDRMTFASAAPVHLLGSNVPLHSSAYGKLFLAYQIRNERDRILKSLKLEQYTPTTITELEEFKNHLDSIRKQGYSLDNGETRRQLNGMAAPIINADGHIAAAIAITAEQAKLDIIHDPKIISYLVDKTFFISRQLGYH